MRSMQTCPAGEVRGSKRKGWLKPHSGFFGGTAAQRWGSQNPKGSALAVREGGALSLEFRVVTTNGGRNEAPASCFACSK